MNASTINNVTFVMFMNPITMYIIPATRHPAEQISLLPNLIASFVDAASRISYAGRPNNEKIDNAPALLK